jgi:hypothetical protein
VGMGVGRARGISNFRHRPTLQPTKVTISSGRPHSSQATLEPMKVNIYIGPL